MKVDCLFATGSVKQVRRKIHGIQTIHQRIACSNSKKKLERGGDMVTITTHDGRIFTDPSLVQIPRNENTEKFYLFLESVRLELITKEEPA